MTTRAPTARMVTLLFVGASLLTPPSANAETIPITPCRVIDTREPGEGPALVGQATRTVVVRGVCGIPQEATAITYNATIAGPAGAGFWSSPGSVDG